jgi:peptidoglycan-N-acetylglucosamine deacetylase
MVSELEIAEKHMRRLLLIVMTLLLGGCTTPQAAEGTAQRRIALSFDDAPRDLGPWLSADERTQRLIAAMRAVRAPQAVFFVNPGHLERPFGAGGEQRLADYVRAGHVLANHSHNHRSLTEIDADAYLAEIDRAELWLRERPGYRPWFRFPYLNEGRHEAARRSAVFAGLAARGMRHGYVTIDGSDWNLEQLTKQAVRAGQTVDRAALRELYVETMVEAAEFYDDLAQRTWGRSPAHILLLHETDLAALYIDDLIRALRARGWQIISADEAYADPIASLPPPQVPSGQGPLTELAAWERGLPAPRWYDRNNDEVMTALFNERVLHRNVGESASQTAPP